MEICLEDFQAFIHCSLLLSHLAKKKDHRQPHANFGKRIYLSVFLSLPWKNNWLLF